VRFYGYGKNFLKTSALRAVPTLLYRKVFGRNLNTECKIFLKIKKPIEFSQWTKSSAYFKNEAGAVVLKGDSVGFGFISWLCLPKQGICSHKPHFAMLATRLRR
jgi:hypothetical protein